MGNVVKMAVEGGCVRRRHLSRPMRTDCRADAIQRARPRHGLCGSCSKNPLRRLKGALVILESTSPVGATEQMAGWLAGMRPI
ncbi:hypothetical protein KCP70_11840 [Salmonella enterica subsp. enterica]|nr:hypothetical protein KCP70_11840 [Salmonella enterica subsp. enterica]